MATMPSAAMNLPATTSKSRTGEVSSSSSVPSFDSSASNRMVITGPSSSRTKAPVTVPVVMPPEAWPEKNSRREASRKGPLRLSMNSRPVKKRNAAMITYAMGDAK